MDLCAQAVKTISGALNLFTKDLAALPEDAFTQKFGGCARTVADIVYEVTLVNDHIGMVIRGETPFDWPEGGWITAPPELDSKEKIITAFGVSAKKTLETVQALSQEDLEGIVEADQGPATRFGRIQFMALHIWYHSGQLNFMQTLRGDDGWHWN